MKKLVVALLLIVGMTAMAQEKEMKRHNGDKSTSLTPEQKIDRHVKKMTKDLNLNETQAKEVKILVTKEVEKREALRKEMQAKRKAEHAAKTAEMKKILTAEQFTKWEKIQEERKANMKEKMSQKRRNKELNAVPEEK